MYYVIQVITGKEERTLEDIKKISKDEPYFEVFSPSRKVMRKYKGEYKEVKEQCFPGYLFVKTDQIKRLFYDLYEIPGFKKVLGGDEYNQKFLPLSKEEERMVEILYDESKGYTTDLSDIELNEGDMVKILSGPLMFMDGKIKKIDLHKRKATIELSLFKRAVLVQVGINIIKKV